MFDTNNNKNYLGNKRKMNASQVTELSNLKYFFEPKDIKVYNNSVYYVLK